MNGVIRRAEVYSPQHFDNCTDIEPYTETPVSISTPPGIVNDEGWFTHFFCRRADLIINHVRHTT